MKPEIFSTLLPSSPMAPAIRARPSGGVSTPWMSRSRRMSLGTMLWGELNQFYGALSFLILLLFFRRTGRDDRLDSPGHDNGQDGPGHHPDHQPPRGPGGDDGATGGLPLRSTLSAETPAFVPRHSREQEARTPPVSKEEEVHIYRSAQPPNPPIPRFPIPVMQALPPVRLYTERELRQLHSLAVHAHSSSSNYAGA